MTAKEMANALRGWARLGQNHERVACEYNSADLIEALQDKMTARTHPLDDWHEDIGVVLWWKFPVDEPPYCGSPLDEDWPGYHTHFTLIVMPQPPKEG